MNIALEYIKYRLKAKGRHGIHSPFVYEFVDSCLSIPMSISDQDAIKKLTSRMMHDKRTILVSDHGAGSKRMNDKRKIKSIFQNSSSKGKYGKLLYQLAKQYHFDHVLELGTSLGTGTTYFKLGNPEAIITTIDACKETQSVALENFEFNKLGEIEAINATFNDYFETKPTTKFDLVFVDGHHEGNALIEYLSCLKAITHNETVFVLDDIRWSESMLTAWNTIVADDTYHVTLDLFRIGIVIPRTQQEKEHFWIKI